MSDISGVGEEGFGMGDVWGNVGKQAIAHLFLQWLHACFAYVPRPDGTTVSGLARCLGSFMGAAGERSGELWMWGIRTRDGT